MAQRHLSINRSRLTDTEIKSVAAKGGGGVQRRKGLQFGISRRKQLYIEWTLNKVPLYSTGNYTQYPAINYNAKEYK